MRLFLLPISTRRTLIYAQRINEQLSSKQTLVEKITARAGATWLKWEASKDGSLQKRITGWGNAALSRIPYQEWGLKSIPPLGARRKTEELKGKEKVIVEFPSGVLQGKDVADRLRVLATERQGLHRKGMIWSMVGLPLTAPIGLIPILPNLPFFYLAFRAWSHWRALSGSKHLEYLLDQDFIHPSPSRILQKLYAIGPRISKESLAQVKSSMAMGGPTNDLEREEVVLGYLDRIFPPVAEKEAEVPTAQKLDDPKSPKEQLLLSRDSGMLLARSTGEAGLQIEVERAVEQVSQLIKKEQEGDATTKEQARSNEGPPKEQKD